MGIQTVLEDFHSFSRLSVGYRKSELYYFGVSKEVQDNLAAIVGLKSGTLPVRYMGVPLSFKKLTVKDGQPLLDKIRAHIISWTSRFLS